MNIVFEGVDASGKTTAIRAIKKYLDEHNIKNKVVADLKEPTPLLPVFNEMFSSNFLESKKDFNTSVYETLLFACSHFYAQEQNRNNKGITIYDRDIFTLLSYQKEILKKNYSDNYELFWGPFREMMKFCSKRIDLIVYVHVPITENIRRKEARDGIIFTEIEKTELQTFKKNMEMEIKNYQLLHPDTQVLSIDGMQPVEKSCQMIANAIYSYYRSKKTSQETVLVNENETHEK